MTLTASSLPRIFACKASAVLPRQDYQSEHADAGQSRHEEQSTAIEAGDTSVIPDEVLALVDGLDLEVELAMAYDVSTGEARIIGRNIGRAYGETAPFEICGSCDLLGHGQGRVVIVDWKSHASVDHPAENAQLLCYALMAARIFEVTDVTIVVAHIVESNRRVHTAKLDAFDLDAFAASLKKLHGEVAAAHADPHAHERTGKHCRYCQSFNACKAQGDLVQLVRREDRALAELRPSELPVLSADTAPEFYRLWGLVKMLSKRMGEALHSYASHDPIPLGDNRWFGKHTVNGNRSYDGRTVHAVLTERYGREVADDVVEMTATQKAIEDKLKEIVPKGAAASAKKAVLEEVEARGGLTRKTTERIEEFTQPLKLASGGES